MNEEEVTRLQQQYRAPIKKHQESILKDPFRDKERDNLYQVNIGSNLTSFLFAFYLIYLLYIYYL